MATVPSPRTWATGDKLTAARLNTEIRDAIGFVLSDAPILHVTQDSAQSAFAATTWTDITFNNEIVDSDAQHSTVSNTARVNIGTTLGYYMVCGVICWATNTTGNSRRARIALNGTAVNGSFGKTVPGADGEVATSTTPWVIVQATDAADYITLQGYHDASGSIATRVTSEARPSLTVVYLRFP